MRFLLKYRSKACSKNFYYTRYFSFVPHSQVGGKYTYQFLNLVTSPRQAALGGKITIYDDDVNQVNFNPATINEMDNHLALNYGILRSDLRYSFLCLHL
jgi:hypothetical protein